jgi:predicted pyridoxine 5'-phosphate oxidase superfamily flavin-nucleotide-binding protein
MYHRGQRELQDRHDSRRLADRIEQRLVHDRFTDEDRAFIERLDMFFLATADEEGRPTCSYKGGNPGFVRVLGERTLAFPNYDGNGMYLSFGNVTRNPHVGMLFIDFAHPRRLRVEGEARIDHDDPLRDSWPGAEFVVRVTARVIYPNCPRYIHKLQDEQRSEYVPRAGEEPPAPKWKGAEWARDVLPKK